MKHTLSRIRQVFLDMDGTIYCGKKLFPTTIPFLEFLKSRGIGWTFLSNNSSYGAGEYAARLESFGIRSRPEEFYISTDYAIDFLKREHPGIRRIFPVGMPCLVEAFETAGFEIDRKTPQAVMIGFDRRLTYGKLCRAAWFLRQGVPGFATHPDACCPTDRPTCLVDCGAVTACLEYATGRTLQILGKPDAGMLREAAARRGVSVGECLMVGDRISTDIALGVNAGAMTCHIAGPETDPVRVEGIHPDLTVADLGELRKIWSQTMEEME